MAVFYVQLVIGPIHAPETVHAVTEAATGPEAIAKVSARERDERGLKKLTAHRTLAHQMPPGFRVGRSAIGNLRRAQAYMKEREG